MLRSPLRRFWLILPIVMLLAVSLVGLLSDRHQQYKQNIYAGNYQYTNGTVKGNSSTFLIIATWAERYHDALEALSAIGAFILTLVLVSSTIGLWIVTKAAADAAKAGANAAETAAKAAQAANQMSIEIFRDERRPILSITIEKAPSYDFIWNETRGKTRISVIIKNHGRSPARIAREDFLCLAASHSHPRNLNNAMRELIKSDVRSVVQDDFSWGTVYTDNMWSQFHDVDIDVSSTATDGWISLSVLCCVWYDLMDGRAPVYEIATSWRMIQRGTHTTDRFVIGQNVPHSALDFMRNLAPNSDRQVPENEIRRL
jgi:hypothetical protein